MKLLGVIAVFGGLVVFALNAIDVFSAPSYAVWVPVAVGALMLLMDR